MKYFTFLFFIALLIGACRKKTYKPYIGIYDCQVTEHIDSVGKIYSWDSVYQETNEIFELDYKNMQFRDLPIPYKYIQKNGEYITGHFVTGVYWGREITLRNDSLYYFHYEGTSDFFWTIRYAGKRQ